MPRFITYRFTLFFVLSALLSCQNNDKEVREFRAPKLKKEIKFTPPKAALSWDVPKGWVQKKGSSLRVGSFDVAQGKADASIVILGGAAGGVVANVNRWRQQIGLETLKPEQIAKATLKDKGKLGEFVWFKLVNEKQPDQAIYAAIMNHQGKSVFLKLSGPASVLKSEETHFLNLGRSIQ